MKRILCHITFWLALILPSPAFTMVDTHTDQPPIQDESPEIIFLHTIPGIAEQFIGIPFEWGGNPQVTGTSDNSYLFFSIYSLAAQKAGFVYQNYLPMRYLLKRTYPIEREEVRSGDLMVLNDGHAAMVYRTEPNGRIHLIYASGKRQQVIAFNSDNLVFQIYWMENLKGFYRINGDMLR